MGNAADQTNEQQRDADVIVIGGGAAGPGAALFLARFGLDVLLFDKGKSAIRQCAFLENYPGFPGGISVRKYLEFVHEQLRDNGCELIRENVHNVCRDATDQFTVHTSGSSSAYRADRVIAATAYDLEYLKGLPEDACDLFFDDEGQFRWDVEYPDGTTGVDGLYIAGRSAGADHQVVAGSGHGASVALGIIKEEFEKRGFWRNIADYLDWTAYQGRYESDDFFEHIEETFEETVPDDADKTTEEIQQIIEEKARQIKDRQMTKEEARRRDRQAQIKLIEALDDDVVNAYFEKHYASTSADEAVEQT